jgi:hypothetical protein
MQAEPGVDSAVVVSTFATETSIHNVAKGEQSKVKDVVSPTEELGSAGQRPALRL